MSSPVLICLTVVGWLSCLTIWDWLPDWQNNQLGHSLKAESGIFNEFDNSAEIPYPPANSSQTTRSCNSGPRKDCPLNSPILEIALVCDQLLCDRFDRNESRVRAYMDEMVRDAESILSPKTCIRLEIKFHSTHCGKRSLNPATNSMFNLSSYLQNCSVEDKTCSRSEAILESLKEEWEEHPDFRLHHDILVLITGEEDKTDLLGAAYIGSPCGPSYGYAWLEVTTNVSDSRPSGEILAHEIGHTIGARHDPDGIMIQDIQPGHHNCLSDSSAESINYFLTHDPQAWCLYRGTSLDRYEEGWWENLGTISSDSHPVDIAVVRWPVDAQNFIYVLSEQGNQTDNSVISIQSCKSIMDGKIDETGDTGNQSILSECTGCTYGGITIRQLKNSTSVALVVAFTRGGENDTEIVGHFRMSRPGEPSGNTHQLWVKDAHVPGWVGDSTRRSRQEFDCGEVPTKHIGQIVAIGSGEIFHSEAADLIWMFVVKERGRMRVKYKVGSGLDVNGNVTDGWGKDILVPGWFSEHMDRLRVVIHNVGGNDKNDLIVSHEDHSHNICASFYRVGFDLNSTGHVTGGWSDDIRIPTTSRGELDHVLGKMRFRGMGVSEITPGDPTPFVMYADGQLISGDSDKIWADAKSRETLNVPLNVSDLCYKCYSEQNVEKCTKSIEICASRMDEVLLGDGTRRMADTNRETKRAVLNTVRDELVSTNTSSMSCNGFTILYNRNSDDRDGCDLTSPSKVMMEGALSAFKGILTESFKEILYFEEGKTEITNSAGTNGPVATSVSLILVIPAESSERVSGEAIRRVALELEERSNIGHETRMEIMKSGQLGRNRRPSGSTVSTRQRDLPVESDSIIQSIRVVIKTMNQRNSDFNSAFTEPKVTRLSIDRWKITFFFKKERLL